MEAELQAGNQTYIHKYKGTHTQRQTDRHMNPTAQPHEPHTISAANADSLQPITVHRAIALKCISVRLWRRHSFCFRQGRTSHEGPAPDIQWHLGWWSHAWRLEACHHPSTAKGVQGPFGPWIVSADFTDLDSVQGHGEDGHKSAPMVCGGAGLAHQGPDWLPAE